jgi:hypothetical protein
MSLFLARAVLFAAGFLLWALTSGLPVTEPIREGWDRSAYMQIGFPLVFLTQVVVARYSSEKMLRAPLWAILGHVAAMLVIYPPGAGLGLLPLAVIVVGLPFYLMLVIASFIGRVVRGLTSPL